MFVSLAQAIECGMSVSHAFSAGNQCDVDIADLVAYLVDEPACRTIACVFEGMAERLMSDPEIRRAAEAMQEQVMNDPETRRLLEELMKRMGGPPA